MDVPEIDLEGYHRLVNDEQLNFELRSFEEEECYRFYAKLRKEHCTFLQIMDLWLAAPLCMDCAASHCYDGCVRPDVHPSQWQLGLMVFAGSDVVHRIEELLQQDPDYTLLCRRCRRDLRPWDADEICVDHEHLEERFSIPMVTPGRRHPSARLKSHIKRLYGSQCFHCGSKRNLSVDHIIPQSKGGTSAFRNLQPLCDDCGNLKKDQMPTEIEVTTTIYFGPYPSDGFEGLFWDV